MHQKGFAHLFLILILGLGLTGGYYAYSKGFIQLNTNPNQDESMTYASPTPITEDATITPTEIIETKDWKTHTNTQVNFSVKYPNTWKTKSIADGKGVVIESPNIKYNTIGTLTSGAYITVELWPYKFNGDISSLIEKSGKKTESDVTIISSNQLILPGGVAVKTVSEAPGGRYTMYQIPKGDDIYASSNQVVDSSLESIVGQIVETINLE